MNLATIRSFDPDKAPLRLAATCRPKTAFLRLPPFIGLIMKVRSGSEVAGRTVDWEVCLTRLRAQKRTDSHRPDRATRRTSGFLVNRHRANRRQSTHPSLRS